MAEIVKKAAEMFPRGMPPKDRFERQAILLKLYPKAEAFRNLDEEFIQTTWLTFSPSTNPQDNQTVGKR